MKYTFHPGRTYRVTIKLSGLQMMLADEEDVAEEIKDETGLQVQVKKVRTGHFEATGTFHGDEPLTLVLPEEVVLVQEVPR